jgi:Arm DNA-binding domain
LWPGSPPPEAGRIDVWDTLLPRFGVRVNASGSRIWIAMTRRAGARNAGRVTIGRFPAMDSVTARAAGGEERRVRGHARLQPP